MDSSQSKNNPAASKFVLSSSLTEEYIVICDLEKYLPVL